MIGRVVAMRVRVEGDEPEDDSPPIRVDMPAALAKIVTEKDWTQDADHFFWDVDRDFVGEDGDPAFIQVDRHWPWNVCLFFASGGDDRELSAGEIAMVHGLMTRINEARYSEGASA